MDELAEVHSRLVLERLETCRTTEVDRAPLVLGGEFGPGNLDFHTANRVDRHRRLDASSVPRRLKGASCLRLDEARQNRYCDLTMFDCAQIKSGRRLDPGESRLFMALVA